jgi:hypothetical protein
MDFSDTAPVLHAIAMAEVSNEPLDLPTTATELELSEIALRERIEEIEHRGLALAGLDEACIPSSSTQDGNISR